MLTTRCHFQVNANVTMLAGTCLVYGWIIFVQWDEAEMNRYIRLD